MRPRICLNMIVKDETQVIERCLSSLRPYIDRWCIVDTGSTDGTQDKIKSLMSGLPGNLHERPWKNFGHNRSEAAALAYQEACDYLLFMDADDTFLAPANFEWPALDADVYEVMLQNGNLRYTRAVLVSTRLSWRWEGVLHEYPTSTPTAAGVAELIAGITIRSSTEGARSRDPDKYKKDAAVLREALQAEPDNSRYWFYLGQSLRDAGSLDEAIEAYRKRVGMGGWYEEHWRAALEIARIEQRRAKPFSEVEQAYLEAFELRVQRAEPLVDLAKICRQTQRWGRAYLYASQACKLPQPADRLFVEIPAYSWQRWDELAIAAYYVGEYAESEAICRRLLSGNDLPETERARLLKNQDFAKVKICNVPPV